MEKFNNVSFGYVDITSEAHKENEVEGKGSELAAAQTDGQDAASDTQSNDGDASSTSGSQKDDSENLSCEPFVFAAMKSSDFSFDDRNMKLILKVSSLDFEVMLLDDHVVCP